MSKDPERPPETAADDRPARPLSDPARRALAEAEARRAAAAEPARPTEKGGRNGPEPVRYGDWEKNGIISDF
ncbi:MULTISPECIES: DUF1674 domain-containing protein [unclassified Aureimonas]|uniref:DUF1674 domain-containing protein n=1 Tax=unclassified Aureimonas TaxID=2615206 RepID=UPI0006FE1C2D|nr:MULTISPECIES: DUF1674 domain-containing protein [unclassified Aureimonas]KQT52593.1 hypothetical protein ASG62_15440 [Aureimonas sp. Leaf427]KQT77507.1 hypothetical protein ASG54_10970 [Aureimonas sp. Leaf460]